MVASADIRSESNLVTSQQYSPLQTTPSTTFEVVYGDHQEQLKAVTSSLLEAARYASCAEQRDTISALVDFFSHGEISAHKTASKHWLQDKDPVIEFMFGFIESYRDPLHVRAEWRGFVAIQNKAQTRTFERLNRDAERLLSELPWASKTSDEGLGPFEKDAFRIPNYTSRDSEFLAVGSLQVILLTEG